MAEQDITHFLQLALSPVITISASGIVTESDMRLASYCTGAQITYDAGLLCLAFYNRLAFIVGRLRTMQKDLLSFVLNQKKQGNS
jgi:hypothetical protein